MADSGEGYKPEPDKLAKAKAKAEEFFTQARMQGRINNEAARDAADMFDIDTLNRFAQYLHDNAQARGETPESVRRHLASMLVQDENKELWEGLTGRTAFNEYELKDVEKALADYYRQTVLRNSGL